MDSSVKLATGAKLPLLGLGTWQSTDPTQLKAALKAALDVGYRLIDTAQVYGNEAIIGEVLQEYFNTGKLKREDVFITTKLPFYVCKPEDVEKCFERQLRDLQVDYVDLYLFHCPCMTENVIDEKTGKFTAKTRDGSFATVIFSELDHLITWKAMEKLFKEGKAKALGLSNFNEEQIKRIIDNAEVKPHNVQVECHIYWPQHELFDFCKKHNITFTAYSPIGSPGRKECDPGYKWPEGEPLKDSLVVELANKYNKTPAQILIRHLVQRGISTIPKSTKPERVRENCNIFDFKLTDEEMHKLNNLPTRIRLCPFQWFFNHPFFPFKDVDTSKGRN